MCIVYYLFIHLEIHSKEGGSEVKPLHRIHVNKAGEPHHAWDPNAAEAIPSGND